ncbi:hypothetical protein, partial [Noviherbaspirillum sp. ST9]
TGKSPFKEISCSAAIEAFETKGLGFENVRFLSRTPATQSYIRVNKRNTEDLPKLVSIEAMTIDYSFIKIFLDSYVKPTFVDEQDYNVFFSKYLQFYTKFNWDSWTPSKDPAPAHSLITCLKKCHSLNKEDYHLLKWGNIMAVLNGGKFNKSLTNLNESDKRVNDIFQLGVNKGNNTIFYSIDTENGLLEMYDHRGIHCNKVYGLSSGVVSQKREYSIKVPSCKWL